MLNQIFLRRPRLLLRAGPEPDCRRGGAGWGPGRAGNALRVPAGHDVQRGTLPGCTALSGPLVACTLPADRVRMAASAEPARMPL